MMPSLRNLPYQLKLSRLRLWLVEDRSTERIRSDIIEVYKLSEEFQLLISTISSIFVIRIEHVNIP